MGGKGEGKEKNIQKYSIIGNFLPPNSPFSSTLLVTSSLLGMAHPSVQNENSIDNNISVINVTTAIGFLIDNY